MEEPAAEHPLQAYAMTEDLHINMASSRSNASRFTINVQCSYPDPQNPDQILTRTSPISVEPNKPIDRIKREFLETYKDIPNKTYYIGYDNMLFKDGTVTDCGITPGKTVELYAPGKNAAAYHNEGQQMITWSIIIFVIGVASLVFTLATGAEVGTSFQAFFLFLGLLLLIPSTLLIIMGLILIPSCPMPCYFTGTEWC